MCQSGSDRRTSPACVTQTAFEGSALRPVAIPPPRDDIAKCGHCSRERWQEENHVHIKATRPFTIPSTARQNQSLHVQRVVAKRPRRRSESASLFAKVRTPITTT